MDRRHNKPRNLVPSDIWRLEEQLGEMLRAAEGDNTKRREDEFKRKVLACMEDYGISSADVIEILTAS